MSENHFWLTFWFLIGVTAISLTLILTNNSLNSDAQMIKAGYTYTATKSVTGHHWVKREVQ